jgi:hypothetical protein
MGIRTESRWGKTMSDGLTDKTWGPVHAAIVIIAILLVSFSA